MLVFIQFYDGAKFAVPFAMTQGKPLVSAFKYRNALDLIVPIRIGLYLESTQVNLRI